MLPLNRMLASDSRGVSSLRVRDLTCEFREMPLGIDRPRPRLGWTIFSADPSVRNQYQSAYEILVASSADLLEEDKADYWRSGKVESGGNNNRVYQGAVLRSGITCFWKVRIWDRTGRVSAWSLPAHWTMGLSESADWGAEWVCDSKPQPADDSLLFRDNPAPLFRKEFTLPKKIRKATLYISGLGYYEASLNGRQVGNHFLDPGWTDYRKTIFYNTYDVTGILSGGKNCLGVELGNGWYNPLPLRLWGRINMRSTLVTGSSRFISRLVVVYADNTKEAIVSDASWRATDGPVVRNNIYIGSIVDERRRVKGWNLPGLDDHEWRQAAVTTSPGGRLLSMQQPPIRMGTTIRPVSIRQLGDGKYLVDLGRNFGGVVRLYASGRRGDEIHLKYGELLYTDGLLNGMTSVAGQTKSKGSGGPGAPDIAFQEDHFILSGKGRDTLFPKFTFHGFRYVEIDGYPGSLTKDDIQGIPLHSDNGVAGTFHCSDSLFNRIQTASVNTFLSNLFSIQSDCPHREKLGYGGDIVATSEALMANFDMHDFYSKTIGDYVDEEQPDGALPETAPYVGISDEGLTPTAGPIGWGTVVPQLLYQLYQYYGDKQLVADHYQAARDWVEFLAAHADHYIITRGIGDHESLDPKQVELSGTALFFYNATLVEKLALLLDRKEDAGHYHQLSERIRTAFIAKFYNAQTGEVGTHTEANQSFALYFRLLPPAEEPKALAVLRDEIVTRKNTHISTGIFGTKFMFETLSENGLSQLACEMADQRDFPGWGNMLANGATTLWEHWAFSDNTFSHNHPMFGSISGWFYKYLAGIRPDSDAVAYDKVIFQPAFNGKLQAARASYRSPQGMLSASWKDDTRAFHYDIAIPVNTVATVWLPVRGAEAILESGKSLGDRNISDLSIRKGWVVCRVGSGNYHFTVMH